MWDTWVRFIWVRNVLPYMTRTTHIFTPKSKEGNASAKYPGQVSHRVSAHIQVKKLEHCCQIESRHLMLTVQVSHHIFQNQFGSKTASGSKNWHVKARTLQSQPPPGSVDLPASHCITILIAFHTRLETFYTHPLPFVFILIQKTSLLCFTVNPTASATHAL